MIKYCSKHQDIALIDDYENVSFCEKCFKESVDKYVEKNGPFFAPYIPLQISKLKFDEHGKATFSSRLCEPDECTCQNDEEEKCTCGEDDDKSGNTLPHKTWCPKFYK